MNKINKGIASQQSQQVILNPHLNHLPQQIPQQASLQQHHIPPPHILDHTQSQVNNYSFNPQNGHFLNATGNSAVIGGGGVGGNGSLNMFNGNANNNSNNNLHHLQQQQPNYHHYANDSNGLATSSSTYSSNGSLSNINGIGSVSNNQLFSNQHQIDINSMNSNEYYIQQQQQQQANGHLNHMSLNHGLVNHHMQQPPPQAHQQYGQQQTLSNPSHIMQNNMYHQLGSQQQTHHHMHMQQQQQQHLQSQTAGQTHNNYLQMNHLNHAPPQMWTGPHGQGKKNCYYFLFPTLQANL